MDANRIPVIVAVGEWLDRPEQVAAAIEPVALMAKALGAADRDAGASFVASIDSLDVVGFISWRYADPVRSLCDRLGIAPARAVNASMGGETPIRLIHEAALRIARGESVVSAIVGGEALNARKRAKKEKVALDWTPLASPEAAVQFPGGDIPIGRAARRLGVVAPVQVYPFYETATQAAWGQSPDEAQRESAALWAQYARVAADNPAAWIGSAPDAGTIGAIGPDNRMIAFPYPKLMVANPGVNQAAAVLVTSLAKARELGVDEARLIHIWGGAAAAEADDFLDRDRFDRSSAQTAVLDRAVALVGGDATRFGKLELYSCFPVVPKMALRTLGLDPMRHPPTVAGGLTFFGGPLNNYMAHAVCAMVRALRAEPAEIGLLYGQGGYVNKHHALVVSTQPPPAPLGAAYSVQAEAEAARAAPPPLLDRHEGPATIEAYTIIYGRDGTPIQGVVAARTAEGARVMARVPESDGESLAMLESMERSAVGTEGHVRTDSFGKPRWSHAAPVAIAERALRYCAVAREGTVTIVTINRPEAMNALTPEANAELAEVFDDFAADPDQWVAILTGAGDKAFSAGNDLKHTARALARGAALETPRAGFGGITARFDLNKPIIAAVNGIAMGGGFEIALACDLIVAAENAVFALPEPRVGLAALAGGLLRLPRQIGLKQAMGMILTGRRVDAREGMALGFVNEVVSQGEALAAARRWAAQIVACSPMSIRASKEVVQRGQEAALPDADRAQNRHPAVAALFRSADVREGPLAFAQKREPVWSGR